MKLCTDCRYYKAGVDEKHDICTHEKAEHGGVRVMTYYEAHAMRSGICGSGARYFEQVQS